MTGSPYGIWVLLVNQSEMKVPMDFTSTEPSSAAVSQWRALYSSKTGHGAGEKKKEVGAPITKGGRDGRSVKVNEGSECQVCGSVAEGLLCCGSSKMSRQGQR